MKAIYLFTTLLLLSFTASAQSETDSLEIVKMLLGTHTEEFVLDAPDSSFTRIEGFNGYEHPSGAKVIYQVWPIAYGRMLEDLKKEESKGTDSVVFQKPLVIASHSGHLTKLFFKAPDSSFENMYNLTFLFPYQKNTVMVMAVYPVAQDAYFYPAIVRSFGSWRPATKQQ